MSADVLPDNQVPPQDSSPASGNDLREDASAREDVETSLTQPTRQDVNQQEQDGGQQQRRRLRLVIGFHTRAGRVTGDGGANNNNRGRYGSLASVTSYCTSLFSRISSFLMIFLSFICSVGVIVNAFHQRKQFYPSIVYLTKSNASMMVLYVQGLILSIMLGKLVTRIFFGKLRAHEMENVVERIWFALSETMLAFTIFRDDISIRFIAAFVFLIYVKCFHWIVEDRVDHMERRPSLPLLFHLRTILSTVILTLVNLAVVYSSYTLLFHMKVINVELVFGFESAVLCTLSVHVALKYMLNCVDLFWFRGGAGASGSAGDGGGGASNWEGKVVCLLYAEMFVNLVRLILYFLFMGLLMNIYTVPLFTIRPIYVTLRAFKKSLTDIILSRRAIAYMNAHYPDATQQDLDGQSDNTCIICREEMSVNQSSTSAGVAIRSNNNAAPCKKLPCSHIFHTSCLRSWFRRQQTCPTCRLDVVRTASAHTPPNSSSNTESTPQQGQGVGVPQGSGIGPIQPNVGGQFYRGFPTSFPPGMFPYNPSMMFRPSPFLNPPPNGVIPNLQAVNPQAASTVHQTQSQSQQNSGPNGGVNNVVGSPPMPFNPPFSMGTMVPPVSYPFPHLLMNYPSNQQQQLHQVPVATDASVSVSAQQESSSSGLQNTVSPPSTSSAASTSGNPSAASVGTMRPPPPQFSYNVPMPPPSLLLPPMPSHGDDFSGFSDEELRNMEGGLRSHVEARVRALLNIKTLLDAASMEWRQYCTIPTSSFSTSSNNIATPQSNATTTTSDSNIPSESFPGDESVQVEGDNSSSTVVSSAGPSTELLNVERTTNSGSAGTSTELLNAERTTNSGSAGTSTELLNAERTTNSDEMSELRNRRVAKLDKTPPGN